MATKKINWDEVYYNIIQDHVASALWFASAAVHTYITDQILLRARGVMLDNYGIAVSLSGRGWHGAHPSKETTILKIEIPGYPDEILLVRVNTSVD